VPDVLRAEILDNRFRKLCFSHRETPPYPIRLISSAGTKKQSDKTDNGVLE
jgi:hypothetical protein